MKRRLKRNLQQPEMKRIADFPEPLQEALAYWGALRIMGFDAKDIFFGFDTVSGVPNTAHVALITQGKKFVIAVQAMPGARREVVFEQWQSLARLVNVSELDEREANYRKWPIGSDGDYFAATALAIREKGIIIPELAYVESQGDA